MDDIRIYINKDKILELKFFDAVHPTLVHIKADDWKFIYKLYYGNELLFDNGLFTSNYLLCQDRQILILEEYDISIQNMDDIKTDDDVIKSLRYINFLDNKTGKFSKVTGGSFFIQALSDNKLIFSKQYSHNTSEFEIDITMIKADSFLSP